MMTHLPSPHWCRLRPRPVSWTRTQCWHSRPASHCDGPHKGKALTAGAHSVSMGKFPKATLLTAAFCLGALRTQYKGCGGKRTHAPWHHGHPLVCTEMCERHRSVGWGSVASEWCLDLAAVTPVLGHSQSRACGCGSLLQVGLCGAADSEVRGAHDHHKALGTR